ncbi:MAG: DUF1501 domain-containing protein [Fimbriiglobus sp.]
MGMFVPRLEPAGWLPTRRDWLRLAVPAFLAAPALASTPKTTKVKSVLVIFTSGGMSQLDTWDPKPAAPAEVRGSFGSRETSVAGLRFGEHMPKLAALAHRFTVLKSMTHDDADHGSACYLALTGQQHPRKSSNPKPAATDFPNLGAVVHRVRPSDRFPHTAMQINGPLWTPREPGPGQYGGFLGRAYDPLEFGDVSKGVELLRGLDRTKGVDVEARRGLAEALDQRAKAWPTTASQTDIVKKTYELLDNPRTRTAFDLDQEPAKIRDRYGRYRAGQACLLARRLVEAGVPWITTFFNYSVRGQDALPNDTDAYGWDTHNDIFSAMKDHLLPRFDQTFSVLLEDLRERGLLDSTLVVCMGEFGRAPLVAVEKTFLGSSPGRKHWPACYSIVLAGGGITPGAVYGASDRHGAYPQANPVTPGDLAATMLHALGLPAETHYTDATGRPYRATTGQPVLGLFS